jgi:ribokinase
MATILVSGLINIETTVRVESFPIIYTPVGYPFFGVNSTVSGVGFNIAKALTILGDEVRLLSMIGRDPLSALVRSALKQEQIDGKNVLDVLEETAQSVILYDGEGKRQINLDLKDVQETTYPEQRYKAAVNGCDLAVLSNINFSRPFLEQARKAGRLVATDVHAITDLNDAFNADFLRAANILFMSHEWLPVGPEEFARRVWNRYSPDVLVIGLGPEGALLALHEAGAMERIPAVHPRKVVSTIGAGDALFSAFLHFYCKSGDPYSALRKAMIFASHKIGVPSASEGFLDEAAVEQQYTEMGDS